MTTTDDEQAGPHPALVGRKVTLRPGRPGDASKLRAILAEPSVSRWWAEPDPVEVIEEELRGDDSGVLLVVEIDGQVAGGIQYHEENDPMYRHAGIDIYLGRRFQGRGAGTEAVGLLARYLFEQRGHHRITIDPAAGLDRVHRFGLGVGEQLQRRPSRLEHDDPPGSRTPVRDLLQPQRVPVERDRSVEVLHRQRHPQLRHITHALFLARPRRAHVLTGRTARS